MLSPWPHNLCENLTDSGLVGFTRVACCAANTVVTAHGTEGLCFEDSLAVALRLSEQACVPDASGRKMFWLSLYYSYTTDTAIQLHRPKVVWLNCYYGYMFDDIALTRTNRTIVKPHSIKSIEPSSVMLQQNLELVSDPMLNGSFACARAPSVQGASVNQKSMFR